MVLNNGTDPSPGDGIFTVTTTDAEDDSIQDEDPVQPTTEADKTNTQGREKPGIVRRTDEWLKDNEHRVIAATGAFVVSMEAIYKARALR